MFQVTRRVRVAVVAMAALVTTVSGLSVAQTQAPSAAADECFERFVGAPINEKGIQCPGDPAIWKSYTFASSGIGYYTETADMGNGTSEVRMGYMHRDGRLAIAFLNCGGSGCVETFWNGVPFPFQG